MTQSDQESAQSNKADTNDIDRLEDAKKLMEWERYDDPTLLEYLRYYKGGIIGEVHIEAAIAQETNKAVQAREQQLLSELLGKAIEYKAPFYMPSGKAVPVSVIERLQNKTNDGGSNGD